MPAFAPALPALLARAAAARRPLVMGVVNVTPDSFHDGGRFATAADAVAHARRLVDEGADLLDLGGESTRPGARPVPVDEELGRVLPVLQALALDGVPVSVDTRRVEVMRAALAAGAAMLNDVQALQAPGAEALAAAAGTCVCLMHMQGQPRTMQAAPQYTDVVGEVEAFLLARAAACIAAGLPRDHVVLDPGFGFGKALPHNVALLQALPRLAAHGFPLLVGVSRKSMIGGLTGRAATADRLAGSLAAALHAARHGAAVLRVHDVAETRDALRVQAALQGDAT